MSTRVNVRRLIVAPLTAIAVLCSAVLWVACSSPPELASADAGLDAPVYDAAPPTQDASTTTCDLGDGGVAPQGAHLVTSPTVGILGVTRDGYAIYQDRRVGKIFAIALSGGEPEQIGPAWGAGSTVITISGTVVSYWTGIPSFARSPLVGQLVVWSAAGHSRILSASSIAGPLTVSDDGKYIAYSDATTATFPDAGTGDGVATTDFVVSAPDGSGKTTVASKVVWSTECRPSTSFVGSRLVLASCAAAKLPQPAATLRAYAAPSFTGPVVLNNQPAYTSVGHDAARVIYYTAGFVLTVQNVVGGPLPLMGNVYNAWLSHDGSFVVILNANGAIYRASTTAPGISYISSGYVNIQAISPDDKWLVTNKSYDPDLGLYDVFLLSTSPASNPTPLVAAPTGAFLNDWFTADNARVIFGANNKPAPYGFFGDFAAVPLSAPTTPAVTVSSTVWSAYATKGSKTVFNDGYDIVFPALPTADIQVIDLASPTTRTKLVSHADANFYVNADRTKAAYSWTYCADQRAGLYVVDLP